MCSDYEPPGNEYCVVTPNSFSLGASDKFALAKVGPAPQCLIINPNDNFVAITMTNVEGTVAGGIDVSLASVEVSEKPGQAKYMAFTGEVGKSFAIPPRKGHKPTKSAFLIEATAFWRVQLEGAANPATLMQYIFNPDSDPSGDFKIHAHLDASNGMKICMRDYGNCIEPDLAATIDIRLANKNNKFSFSFDADLTLGNPLLLAIKKEETTIISNVCDYLKNGLKMAGIGSSDLAKVIDFFCGDTKVKFKVHLGSIGAQFEASIGSLKAKLTQKQVDYGRKYEIEVTKNGKKIGSAWYQGCGLGPPFGTMDGGMPDWCMSGQSCEYINPATGYRCTGKAFGDSSKICPANDGNHACYDHNSQARDHTKCKWGDYCGKNPGIGWDFCQSCSGREDKTKHKCRCSETREECEDCVTVKAALGEEDEDDEGGGAPCFPADSIVQVRDSCGSDLSSLCVTSRRMDQLKIGDLVESDNGQYEPIIAFTHRNYVKSLKYRRFVAGNHTLEIADGHYLFANGKLQMPENVRVGDVFSTGDAVSRIELVHKMGLIHPHTWSSTLVVNGIKTSVNTNLYDAPLALYFQDYVTTPVAYAFYKLGAPLDFTEGSRFWHVEEFVLMTKDMQNTLRRALPEMVHPVAAILVIASAFIYAFPIETFVTGCVLISMWFSLPAKQIKTHETR